MNTFIFSKKEIDVLCSAGSQAPSGANAQPWKIVIKRNTFTIMLDRKRSGSFLDVGCAASFFAIGCMVENICIAASSLQLLTTVRFDEKSNPFDTIIIISFERNNKVREDVLFNVISSRVTNRRISDGTRIPDNIISSLDKNITSKLYHLSTVYLQEDKKNIAQILGKADGIRIQHNELFRLMIEEFRWSPQEAERTRDGLDLATLEMPVNLEKMMRLQKKYPEIRQLMPLNVFEDMAKPLILGSSHVACLSTTANFSQESIFIGGRILERIWLDATLKKIAFQPWSVVTYFCMRNEYFAGEGFSEEQKNLLDKVVRDLRRLFGLSKNEIPLFIFRLSYAPPPSARSLKRSWKEFTTILV